MLERQSSAMVVDYRKFSFLLFQALEGSARQDAQAWAVLARTVVGTILGKVPVCGSDVCWNIHSGRLSHIQDLSSGFQHTSQFS